MVYNQIKMVLSANNFFNKKIDKFIDKDANIDVFIYVLQKMNYIFLPTNKIHWFNIGALQVVLIQRKYISEINLINLL